VLHKFKALILTISLVITPQVVFADARVKAVQEKLLDLGYNPGVADGLWGRNTQSALEQFMSSKGQSFDGTLDQNELKLLKIKSVRCVAKPHSRSSRMLAKSWSREVSCSAEVFIAADLKYQTKVEIENTLDAGADEWGNYGPVEYWVLGADRQAALNLAKQFCKRRSDRRDWDYNSCYQRETREGDHGLTTYQEIGAGALKSGRPSGNAGHNGGMDWGIHRFSSSMPLGFEKKLRVKGQWEQITILHEYFHGVQHAHSRFLERSARNRELGPMWFMEGAATYMSYITQSKLVREGKLKRWPRSFDYRDVMVSDFEKIKRDDKKHNCVKQMPSAEYNSPCNFFFYQGGAWATAYLINKTDRDVLLKAFYPNIEKHGWEGAFEIAFDMTPDDFYGEFEEFMKTSRGAARRILLR